MPGVNRGIQELLRQVPNHGDRQRAALALNVTPGHLSRVLSGEKPAGLPFRQAALKAFGIAMDAWDEPLSAQPENERARVETPAETPKAKSEPPGAPEPARASQRPREDAATDPQEPIDPHDSDVENTAVDIEPPPKSARFVDESESQVPPRRGRSSTPAGAQ
jgi:hypothetical protein